MAQGRPRSGFLLLALLVFSIWIFQGCSSLPAQSGAPPIAGAQCAERIYDRLYFGRDVRGRILSEEEWQSFVAREIAPRFPAGFTVLDASGQWRDAQQKIVREPTKVVELVHEGDPGRRAAIQAMIDAYKNAYQQEAVLLVETRTLACF